MSAKLSGPSAFAFVQSGFLLPATLAVSTPKIIDSRSLAADLIVVDREVVEPDGEGRRGLLVEDGAHAERGVVRHLRGGLAGEADHGHLGAVGEEAVALRRDVDVPLGA